jgi:anaerobic selenocysteine-containing dehydrogenase
VAGGRARTAFSLFRDHVREATPEWAASVCDVPAADVRDVARGMAENAMLGSTTLVDGVRLPYRPVGVMLYHAAQQELGFQATRAIVQVLMLLGAVGAVGGVQMAPKWEIHDNYFALDQVEISDGPYDHLLKGSKYFPINTGNPALGARTMLEPERYGVGKTPEVMIVHMSNLAVSYPDSPAIQEAYARVPFTVVISPWLSETADLLADVVLPAATLEKYEGPLSATDAYVDAVTLRVPPMEPLFESRGEVDIYLDLCERVGVLYGKGGYLDLINEHLGLTGRLALPLRRKPTAREIFDRWARTQGAEEGVRRFEEQGVLVKGPLPPEVRYGYATEPPFGGVVHRFYGESLLRYRDEMRRRGAEEIFWRDYTPLPTWRPPTMEGSPPEYDLYLVSYKLVEHKQSRTSFVPLLAELTGGQRLDINPRTARARGIADGQPVVVESHNAVTGETRRVTVRARYTEAIRPDVVAMPHHFGLWTHPWAEGQGPSPNVLYFSGPGYVANTADQSFHVKVRVLSAEEA